MKDLAKFFGLTVSALLPLINPLGSALVFMGVVGAAPAAVYRALSKRIALNTTLFMLVIQAAGPGCIVVMVTLSAHASTIAAFPSLRHTRASSSR